MIVDLQSAPGYLDRDGSWFDPRLSWTIGCWYHIQTSTPTGGAYRQAYNRGGNGYVYLGSNYDTNDVILEVSDGSSYYDTTAYALTLGISVYLAATYDAATFLLSFCVNGAIIGSMTHDMSGWDFGTFPAGTGEQVFAIVSWGDHAIERLRIWQRCLTLSDIQAEQTSKLAASATSLLADTPLIARGNVTDQSGNGHSFTYVGASLTFLTGPLAPVNTTRAAALPVTLPASVTVDLSDAVSTGLWYTHTLVTPPRDPLLIGMAVLPNAPSQGALLRVFDAVTPASIFDIGSSAPGSFPSSPEKTAPGVGGPTWWFKFYSSFPDVPDVGVSATFTVIAPPRATAAIGSLVIPDDGFGYPAVVLRVSDGEVLRVESLPSGEHGDVLPDGTMCVEARNSSGVVTTVQVYSSQFALVVDAPSLIQAGTFFQNIAADQVDTFYIAPQSGVFNPPIVKAVSQAGVVSPRTWTLAGSSLPTMTVAPGGGILYWAALGLAAPVHRHDLATDTPLSDLAAGVASFAVTELLALADGSVTVKYLPATGTATFVRQYSAAGATLRDYPVNTLHPGYLLNHLARIPDEDTSFLAWYEGVSVTKSIFTTLSTVDGSILGSFQTDNFEHGVGQPGSTQSFGPSISCPVFVLHRTVPRLSVPVNTYTPGTSTVLTSPTRVGLNTQGGARRGR